MEGAKQYLLPGVAAIVLIGLLVARSCSDAPEQADSTSAADDPAKTTPKPPGAQGPAHSGSKAPAAGGAPEPAERDPLPDPAQATPTDPSTPATPERAQRDAMRAKIQRAMGASKAAAEEAESPPRLSPEYIQSRIRDDLVPIAQECYESALAEDPKLAGKLTVSFTIVGAKDVGGVVEEATLDESSTLTQPDVVECMLESMLSVTFDPPPDGGTVTVTYPFVFSSGQEG